MELVTPGMRSILGNPIVVAIFALFFAMVIYEALKRSILGKTPVDRLIIKMLRFAKIGDLNHLWSTFSPALRKTLQDKRRKYLRDRGIYGLKYLEFFVNTHTKAFQVRYIIQSRHIVNINDADTEMMMIHLKRASGKGGLTIWVTRTGGITSHWLIHELYIHARQKEELGYSLTGKSMSTRIYQ
jgi:hypothetical protein